VKLGLGIGTRVFHETFGVGEVLAEKYDGYETLVGFPKFSQWVRTRDLVLASDKHARLGPQAAPRPGSAQHAAPASTIPASRQEARAIVECMRLGVAPPVGIERCTVGRTHEVGAARAWLRDEAEGALVLEGSYGAGKSHLLRYLRADALALGFAVASTGVSPTEGVLTVPRRAYAHLVRDLSVPIRRAPHKANDGADAAAYELVGFEAALERAAREPSAIEAVRDHTYLGPAVDAIARGTLPQSAWSVLRGERTRGALLPPFYEHQTAANLACYLLSGLARLFATAFSLRGLLLLFDEVETAPATRYAYERAHSKNLMRGLTLTSCDDEALLDEAVIVEDGEHIGVETRLVYSGHLQTRYHAGLPSHLKTLFAVTPDTLLPVFRSFRTTVPQVTIEPLEERELRALFDLTCALYKEAYGGNVGPGREALYKLLRTRVPGDHPRTLLKASVELLDFTRTYPARTPSDLLAR
jgi:hypothetical protein